MVVYADRVWETCSGNPGASGAFVLNGAVPGNQSFGSGVIASGQTSAVVPYAANDGAKWETGVGTWSGGQIQRSTVYESNNANTNVNWSGTNINVQLALPSALINQFLTGISSGQIQSGMIAAAAVNATNVASGVIPPQFTLTSGSIQSGMIANSAVLSGSVGSGQLGGVHIANQSLQSGNYGLGSIASGHLASGTIPAPFVLTSGVVTSGFVGNAAVNSGNVGSGSLSSIHFQSGTIPAAFSLTSGIVGSGLLGNASVVSGSYASGSVGLFAMASGFNGWSGGGTSLSSGVVTSGYIGNGAVVSGSIASGTIPLVNVSGNTGYLAPAYSTATSELVSGVRAVAFNNVGSLWQAMAGVSGRMPAVGVVSDNVASGAIAQVYTQGSITLASGQIQTIGLPVWIGISGHIVQASGTFMSGGWQSGNTVQSVGTANGNSSFLLNIGPAYVAASGYVF